MTIILYDNHKSFCIRPMFSPKKKQLVTVHDEEWESTKMYLNKKPLKLGILSILILKCTPQNNLTIDT